MNIASLRSLQHDIASLLLYRQILDVDVVGSAFVSLIEQIYHTDTPTECLKAYSDWFSWLASSGQSWQSYLIESILYDENPFTEAAQHAQTIDDIAPELIAAARHDLTILRRLYDCTSDQIGLWMRQACKLDALPVAPSSVVEPAPIAFDTTPDWGDLLSDLLTYHQTHGVGVFAQYRACRWEQDYIEGIPTPDPIGLDNLIGYDTPKAKLLQNTEFLLAGAPAQHVLLYGSRGSGKSSLVKAIATDYADQGLRLIEVDKSQLCHLPKIIDQIRSSALKFVIFVDDLSFEEDDDAFKALKVVLEGNSTARAHNVVVYATTNRRHLIREFFDDRPRPSDADEIHSWDTVQEKLSFSDRFGLTLTFAPCNQDDYLRIIRHLAQQADLTIHADDLTFRALQWATQNNGRSGRTARQFIDWLTAEQQLSLNPEFSQIKPIS
ncbi:MAG: ATP-binding protein [Coleofasciculaceae cyanobacterium RL_1_1]|nr:ATP-binding protein [Coleofasciculaceae cyanobacterium RL_1_1]